MGLFGGSFEEGKTMTGNNAPLDVLIELSAAIASVGILWGSFGQRLKNFLDRLIDKPRHRYVSK
jgi:hypothetical protein